MRVVDDGREYDIHFAALFSDQEKAIPILLLHGWPGIKPDAIDALSRPFFSLTKFQEAFWSFSRYWTWLTGNNHDPNCLIT